ncbi:MAG: hypothetical protein JW723_00810 [Bacteroidales bacterium]|nr:hypothetical protein [Bacteroidales bacterium]
MKTTLRFLIPSFIFWMILLYLAGIIRFWFLTVTPGNNWEEEAMKADVVIAMGFGIIRDDMGNYQSGRTNDSLLNWMAKYTRPKVIIAQEGILLAKNSENCRETVQRLKNVQLVRMHGHGKQYINTLEAARYALEKANSMLPEKDLQIAIVCHPDQIKRCYFDLTRVAKTKRSWENYSFIIPDILPVPYEIKSAQIHTRSRFLFKTSDILISRPRDFISLFFIRFPWIILSVCILLIAIYGLYRFLYQQSKELIAPEDEDRILTLFLLSNTGLWFLLIGCAVMLSWSQFNNFRFTIWAGLFIGLLTGLRSSIFFNRTSCYQKRPALGEPIGALGIGCFVLAANMILGMISGLWL